MSDSSEQPKRRRRSSSRGRRRSSARRPSTGERESGKPSHSRKSSRKRARSGSKGQEFNDHRDGERPKVQRKPSTVDDFKKFQAAKRRRSRNEEKPRESDFPMRPSDPQYDIENPRPRTRSSSKQQERRDSDNLSRKSTVFKQNGITIEPADEESEDGFGFEYIGGEKPKKAPKLKREGSNASITDSKNWAGPRQHYQEIDWGRPDPEAPEEYIQAVVGAEGGEFPLHRRRRSNYYQDDGWFSARMAAIYFFIVCCVCACVVVGVYAIKWRNQSKYGGSYGYDGQGTLAN